MDAFQNILVIAAIGIAVLILFKKVIFRKKKNCKEDSCGC